jgi:sugar (pentulose or hexulose) kinase
MKTNEAVLAIDMGSSWCKAAYVDRTGEMLAEGRGYSGGGPPFGHDADDLAASWGVLVEAVRDASAVMGNSQPVAIALSCRKAPGVWLDAANHPVSPPRDDVLAAGRQDIDESYAADVWSPLGPFSFGYGVDLIGNTRWLRRRFPDLWAQVTRVGSLHTWLVYRLTGRWATSPAAGPACPAWPEAASELTGLPLTAFPEVIDSFGVAGKLTSEAAEELGLPEGTPVVTGTHDGAAANLGAGAMHAGDACLTLGTNGVVRVVTGEPLYRQFGYPIVEGRWAMVRDIVGIAHHLDRVVNAIDGQGTPVSAERHARLTAQAGIVPLGSSGVRLPVPEQEFLGAGQGSSALTVVEGYPDGMVYRAALEGIALAFKGVMDVVVESGARPQHVVVTGGATANDLLLHMLSGVLNMAVHTIPGETGVRGASILAALGAGWFDSVDTAVDAMVPPGEEIVASLEELFGYRQLAASMTLPHGVAPGDNVRGSRGGNGRARPDPV